MFASFTSLRPVGRRFLFVSLGTNVFDLQSVPVLRQPPSFLEIDGKKVEHAIAEDVIQYLFGRLLVVSAQVFLVDLAELKTVGDPTEQKQGAQVLTERAGDLPQRLGVDDERDIKVATVERNAVDHAALAVAEQGRAGQVGEDE